VPAPAWPGGVRGQRGGTGLGAAGGGAARRRSLGRGPSRQGCVLPLLAAGRAGRGRLRTGGSGVAVVAPHQALFLAVPVALTLGIALVVLLLAARQRHFGLDLVALPVHRGGHQGVALALDLADEL